MATNDDAGVISSLLVFPLISTMVLGILLFVYVFFNDYVAKTLLDVLSDLNTSGLISANFLNAGNSITTLLNTIPQMIDFLFLISFIGMVTSTLYISYRTQRKGYFEIISYLSYGSVIFIFLLSIFKVVSDYIYEMFFGIMLKNLTVQLDFFTYFYNNMFWISLLVLLANILINFIDLNTFKFQQKKQQELMNEEI